MTRRAWILRFLLADALQSVLVHLIMRKHRCKEKRLTWPIGTPFWRKPMEEKE